MVISKDNSTQIASEVFHIEAEALASLAREVPDGFQEAVALILARKGRVILCGMGKSGHIARKIAATFSSTGTPSFFVHPAEASHGDLGMFTEDDVGLLLSNSGETTELFDIVNHCRRFSIPFISITSNGASAIARSADVSLVLPSAREACAIGLAPTTTTTMSLAIGDALAVAAMRKRGFNEESFFKFHPGGKLGARLLRVSDLMHEGEALPLVSETTPMSEALLIMTQKGFGTAAVVSDDRLIGVITDGDLRRNMEGLTSKIAGDVATKKPKTILNTAPASEALAEMHAGKVSSLYVLDEASRLCGIIHIHDCLRAGII